MVGTKSVPGKSIRKYQEIRDVLKACLANPAFKEMREGEPDLENLFMALMMKESSLVPGRIGSDATRNTVTGADIKGAAYKFKNTPKYLELKKGGSPVQQVNILHFVRAWGLAQSMGYNHIRGMSPIGSAPCEIERICAARGVDSTIRDRLLINPGDSLESIMGTKDVNAHLPAFVANQIYAGLVILLDKWSMVTRDGSGWKFKAGGTIYRSPRRILLAMGAYLGFGGKDTVGSDASSYVNQIVGVKYAEANSGSSNSASVSFDTTGNNAPTQTAALTNSSGKTLGCTA